MQSGDEPKKDKRRGLPEPEPPIVNKVFNEPSGSLVLVLGQSSLGASRSHRLFVRTIDDDLYREIVGLGDEARVSGIVSSARFPRLYVSVETPSEFRAGTRYRAVAPDKKVTEGTLPAGSFGFNWKGLFSIPLPQGPPSEIRIVMPSSGPSDRVWLKELGQLESEESIRVKYAKERDASPEETAEMMAKYNPPRQILNARKVEYFLGSLNPETGVLTELEKLDSPFH